MIYSGSAILVEKLDGRIAHLAFDLQGDSVNKFSVQVSAELETALDAIQADADIQGVLISSRKDVFIVGADVTEFGSVFSGGAGEIGKHIQKNNLNFNRLEDLPVPTVVAINGFAMGGGLEICLACDFRLISGHARIGLPESKLGLLPGWGGTVRLARLAGLDTAIEWITSGSDYSAEEALVAKVVDGVVEADKLFDISLQTLNRMIAGEIPYAARRTQKTSPLAIVDMESLLAFESAKMFVGAKAGKNYPAPVAAIKAMQDAAKLPRSEAQAIETQAFVKLAQTSAARNLVGLFLSDQFLIKKAKSWAAQNQGAVKLAAVLGAGIMGGGIAYQSAFRGVPIKMKDIAQAGLDLGLAEAGKLLTKRVEKGKMSVDAMVQVLNRIGATLSYDNFGEVEIVVEAVVENSSVKQRVLTDLEMQVSEDTVVCSNTSTISIDELAQGLRRPENFCGMHFFNPVHAMPLVEVIRGEKTSDATVARTVAYAVALGKKPVIVKNCPGFLVNRVLFPYFTGFSMLLRDGANFAKVDKVMERWGWPMGPAYLLDVVGLDTGVHAEAVMAQGFPERMTRSFTAAANVLHDAGRLGQKNQRGFYRYETDKRGRPVKLPCAESVALLEPHVAAEREFSEEEIISRMMVPMATELARCLEENIVDTAAEADMALIYGLGFPPFRGGIFRWLDELNIKNFIAMADTYATLGPLYRATAGMRQLAADGQTYYQA